MKRLLLPLLAAIAFLHVVLKQIKWDWITRINADMVAVLAVILVIILVLIIFLVAWLAPTPEEQEAEERRIKQYKKEKLISYGHDMKGLNPALYQNLMSPSPDDLPADVSKRYKQGLMWIDDLKAYEDCGFTGTAQQIRDAIAEAQTQKMINETEAMRKRTEARDKAIREKPPGFKGLAPLSPEAIARARAEWGITGN